MLLFFKNLRKQLLSQNKLKNYLLYALGELVLVVAGILIALAINNSREEQILMQKEEVYLLGLQNEFEISKIKLEELVRVNRSNYEKATLILKHASDTVNSLDEITFSNLLNDAFSRDISFNPNTSLIQEMISSGSLKDLSDNELRIQLTNWLATLEDIAGQERDQEIRRQEVMKLFETDKASVRTITDQTGVTQSIIGLDALEENYSNLPLLDDRSFENNLLMFILSARSTETNHYLPLIADLDTILELISLNLSALQT
ncbi:DUF6090 family protein [Robertkochia marina]|uniref:DUF6090 family protein n=1 Tax=Robertkochia marina TaxID=1227945 RepID=UPI001F55472B|nr:DUF6090 family protein [Robertkochia marina]